MSPASDNSRGGRRRQGKPPDAISLLSTAEARAVLGQLLLTHPELRAEAERLARRRIEGDVACENVADEVEAALRMPDLDALNERAGEHYGIYTDPGDAAWDLLWEEVQPFLEQMQRQLGIGMHDAARETFQGVLLGLYRAQNQQGDVAGWAPDFPRDAVHRVAGVWQGRMDTRGLPARGSGRRQTPVDLPAEFHAFVGERLPEWAGLIRSALNGS